MYEHVWDLYDNIFVRPVRQGWTGPKESGPTSQHKHSTIFNEDNITRDDLKYSQNKVQHQTTDGVKPKFKPTDGVNPIFKPFGRVKPLNQTTEGRKSH